MNNIDTYISINCDQIGSSLTDGFVVSGFQTLNKFGKPVTTYEDFLSTATIEYEYYFGNGMNPVALTIHNNEFDASEPDYAPAPASCTYQAIERPAILAGAPTTATFTDGNGQAIQVKSYKKNNNGTDGFVVSGFQTLNKFGKPVTTYEDFLSTSSATTFALPASTLDKVVKDVQYDYQYRQISADNYVAYVAGGLGQWVTSTVEYGFDNLLGTSQPEFFTRSTTLSNSASTNPTPDVSSSEYVDARGRKIGAIQHGANELITQFQYNAIGELLTVLDPIGEVTQYTYDLAGRQLSENHPDRGLSTLTYDKASNVIEMTNPATDAQNDAIHLSYDYNRLTSKVMPSAGGAVDLYNVQYIYGSPGDGNNGAGRVVTIKQGGTFKEDNYKYDELGQIAQEVKTINVPNVGQRTFATTYRYDSFGRILGSVYPDGDSVTYSYYPSGELSGITSTIGGSPQSIISEIYYDGRGNIDQLVYGNGTNTTYEYADRTWTLMGSMVTGKPSGGATPVSLLERDYEYNSLGAISSIERNMHSSLVQGGETQHTFSFTYDAFNRLLDGSMTMNNVSGTAYQVATAFNDAGGILSKTSTVNTASSTLSGNASAMGYDLAYNYNQAKPHQLEAVVDQVSGNTQQFTYNESGSIKQIQDNTQNQEFYWNEEQWLNAVRNDQGIHHYVYDDKGERIMKSSVIQTNVYVNDQIVSTIQDLEPYTLYVNPYFVITEFSNADNVSKHYYMGTQRVASELAVQTTVYSPMVGNTGSSSGAASTAEAYKTLINASNTINQGLESQVPISSNDPWLDNLNAALTEFGEATLTRSDVGKELPTIESIYPDLSPQSSYKTTSTARVIYWYHPDYIGNVDLVTDMSGEAYEFFLYNPWGENLYEWNSGTSTWTSPYRFNGKELDQETGFHYYGARYHEPRLSVWLSVDAMAMKPHNMPLTPYHFSANNPVSIIDPDGNDWEITTFRNDNDELVINIKYTAAVLNSSSQDFDMDKFAEGYKSQLESSYGISYEGKNGSTIHVNMEADIRVINSEDELLNNEHLVTIKDQRDLDPGKQDTYGYVNKIGGKEIDINASLADNMMNGSDNCTLVHETGHTAGLKHIDIKSHAGDQYYDQAKQKVHRFNAMVSGVSPFTSDLNSTQINPQQIQWMYNAYIKGELNLD